MHASFWWHFWVSKTSDPRKMWSQRESFQKCLGKLQQPTTPTRNADISWEERPSKQLDFWGRFAPREKLFVVCAPTVQGNLQMPTVHAEHICTRVPRSFFAQKAHPKSCSVLCKKLTSKVRVCIFAGAVATEWLLLSLGSSQEWWSPENLSVLLPQLLSRGWSLPFVDQTLLTTFWSWSPPPHNKCTPSTHCSTYLFQKIVWVPVFKWRFIPGVQLGSTSHQLGLIKSVRWGNCASKYLLLFVKLSPVCFHGVFLFFVFLRLGPKLLNWSASHKICLGDSSRESGLRVLWAYKDVFLEVYRFL